jgi:hypothetical protein
MADLVGCSEEWLRLVEKGARPLDRLSTIMRIADVLRVSDLSELVGGHVTLPFTHISASDHDDIGHALLLPHLVTDERAENPYRVGRHVTAAWDIWHHSPRRYTELRRRLPALLLMADTSARFGRDDDATTANLAEVYRLYATLLRHCGQHPLALLAADRAATSTAPPDRAATSTAPPGFAIPSAAPPEGRVSAFSPLAVAARREVAEVLIHLGRPADARRLCLATADFTDSPLAEGGCYLTAALAAAEQNDLHHTEHLLNRARRLADHLDPEFAAELELHTVSAAVRTGRYRRAIRLATAIDPAHLSTKDRQARHLLPLATAHAMNRDPSAATATLRSLVERCPEELKYSPQAERVLEELRLLDCDRTRGELREIARLTA